MYHAVGATRTHGTSLIQWKLIPANPGISAGDTLLGATDSYPAREGGIHFQGGAGAPHGVAAQSRHVVSARFAGEGGQREL